MRWSIQNLERDFGFKIEELKITGGGTLNATWMQIIADVTQRKIITTSQLKNAGALGAAMCAMVGSGVFNSFSDIHQLINSKDTFIPNPKNKIVYDEIFVSYQKIYHQLEKTYKGIIHHRF
mgnify:FL=1